MKKEYIVSLLDGWELRMVLESLLRGNYIPNLNNLAFPLAIRLVCFEGDKGCIFMGYGSIGEYKTKSIYFDYEFLNAEEYLTRINEKGNALVFN